MDYILKGKKISILKAHDFAEEVNGKLTDKTDLEAQQPPPYYLELTSHSLQQAFELLEQSYLSTYNNRLTEKVIHRRRDRDTFSFSSIPHVLLAGSNLQGTNR